MLSRYIVTYKGATQIPVMGFKPTLEDARKYAALKAAEYPKHQWEIYETVPVVSIKLASPPVPPIIEERLRRE